MQEISPSLLEAWNTYGKYGAYALVAIGLVVLIYHFLRLASIGDKKTKYDYINKNEINFLWYAFLLIIIGAALYSNTLVEQTGVLWFFVRIFVSSMLGIIAGVVVQNVLKFYYPFYIEKRLKKLRYSPRLSPDGRKMKLLSEEEEDEYLDEGMQAEELAFSVDYDVWIDEVSGYVKIEKYNGRLHALQCSECNYQTLRVMKEEVTRTATNDEDGEMMKYYECSYCGHKERKPFKINRLKPEGEAV
ncbi:MULTISPECIES: hypothetical protein [unclassified Imperialibacter]|jgi:DNA-directed RNA polymerase subunit RPC12/RpoP|uniref:hypothetical protein n=1 Tax=unclassified Imperialibacter TaxID=2629706 RepID=UPI001259FB7F|nr:MULTISPECIES: hypothetical protein [unclassified Imperialibacter]CAD5274034.1 conserved membrane hypothetical protein [Imperialibacter sp. 75]CAD5287666.1 conserved membrane hypothetical protein [Imperialibacter sp. 89]VVT35541.1 conserved membrane hypothetical protein [Imperialibacter sp. EC-SDR9]